MPHTRFKSVNMGKSQTGKPAGYALAGATAWTPAAEVLTPAGLPTGIYGATVTFPDGYTGPLLWTNDTTGTDPRYACEDINPGTDEYADAPTSGIPAAVWSSASRTLSEFTFAVALSQAGLDAVAVEAGVNARQALQAIGAATAGRAAGGSSGTPVFYAMANPTITRITATTNDDGRPAVNLNLN